VPIISDYWPGLDEFLAPGREILIARSAAEVVRHLCTLGAQERAAIAMAARARVLKAHTAACRASQFESHLAEAGAQARPVLAASA